MYTLIDGTLIHTAKETDDVTGKLADLKTSDKSNLVAAINDITMSGNVDHIARQMIDTEIQRSMNVDTSLSSSIAMEVQRATEAENVLNSKITNEIQERQTADNEVLEAIATKANAAEVYTKDEVYTKNETDSILATKVYTKSETNALLDIKADKATTYTKDETDTLLDDKANAADVYTKQESDNLLTAKANSADIYTKTAVNTLLASKANTSDVYSKLETNTLLNNKANTIDVYSKLETNSLLLNKANTTDVYTKQETDTKVAELIDDSIISTSKTWSSVKIENKTSYPEGYVYMQLYNPTLATWEKSPSQLGMTPASGCKWDEITSNFASYPYLKIGSGTTQTGHNAYHRHTHSHTHSHSHTAYTGCYTTSNETAGYGLGGQQGFLNRVMVSGPSNVGTNTDSTGPSTIYTSYNGDSTEQTVEVNASNMKIWKVVADT